MVICLKACFYILYSIILIPKDNLKGIDESNKIFYS